MTQPIATTRGNQMFAVNARPKTIENQAKKQQPPKFALEYRTQASSTWHKVESPYTISKKAALQKLNQHIESPLRKYHYCQFRLTRLKDLFIVRSAPHRIQ